MHGAYNIIVPFDICASRIYYLMMIDRKLENTVGALAIALTDGLLNAAQSPAPESIPAAAIALIGHAPGLTIRDLSSSLGMSHPGAVRLVDRLVRNNVALRSKSPSDGRTVSLNLTDHGKKLYGTVLGNRESSLTNALSSLNKRERELLQSLTEKLLRHVLSDEAHAFRVCRLCDVDVCADCPVEAEITQREGLDEMV